MYVWHCGRVHTLYRDLLSIFIVTVLRYLHFASCLIGTPKLNISFLLLEQSILCSDLLCSLDLNCFNHMLGKFVFPKRIIDFRQINRLCFRLLPSNLTIRRALLLIWLLRGNAQELVWIFGSVGRSGDGQNKSVEVIMSPFRFSSIVLMRFAAMVWCSLLGLVSDCFRHWHEVLCNGSSIECKHHLSVTKTRAVWPFESVDPSFLSYVYYWEGKIDQNTVDVQLTLN